MSGNRLASPVDTIPPPGAAAIARNSPTPGKQSTGYNTIDGSETTVSETTTANGSENNEVTSKNNPTDGSKATTVSAPTMPVASGGSNLKDLIEEHAHALAELPSASTAAYMDALAGAAAMVEQGVPPAGRGAAQSQLEGMSPEQKQAVAAAVLPISPDTGGSATRTPTTSEDSKLPTKTKVPVATTTEQRQQSDPPPPEGSKPIAASGNLAPEESETTPASGNLQPDESDPTPPDQSKPTASEQSKPTASEQSKTTAASGNLAPEESETTAEVFKKVTESSDTTAKVSKKGAQQSENTAEESNHTGQATGKAAAAPKKKQSKPKSQPRVGTVKKHEYISARKVWLCCPWPHIQHGTDTVKAVSYEQRSKRFEHNCTHVRGLILDNYPKEQRSQLITVHQSGEAPAPRPYKENDERNKTNELFHNMTQPFPGSCKAKGSLEQQRNEWEENWKKANPNWRKETKTGELWMPCFKTMPHEDFIRKRSQIFTSLKTHYVLAQKVPKKDTAEKKKKRAEAAHAEWKAVQMDETAMPRALHKRNNHLGYNSKDKKTQKLYKANSRKRLKCQRGVLSEEEDDDEDDDEEEEEEAEPSEHMHV